MRATPVLLLALGLIIATSGASAHAPVTRSCELVPHGFIAGGNTNGCSVVGQADKLVFANVTVISGTFDAIEIEVSNGASQHTFLCAFAAVTSVCVLPVQSDVGPSTWTVTARVVTADPLGAVLGGFDSFAELDATFI